MDQKKKLWASEEEIADCKAWAPDDKGAIRYWLLTGLPDGCDLSDSYPQELIDEVQAEIEAEFKGMGI